MKQLLVLAAFLTCLSLPMAANAAKKKHRKNHKSPQRAETARVETEPGSFLPKGYFDRWEKAPHSGPDGTSAAGEQESKNPLAPATAKTTKQKGTKRPVF